MKNFTDDKLINEIVIRKLIEKVADLLEDDDLVDMIHERHLEKNFEDSDFDEDEECARIEDEVTKEFESSNHILPKFFDRFKLRDHLINIAGLHSHASDKKLFSELEFLLENS